MKKITFLIILFTSFFAYSQKNISKPPCAMDKLLEKLIQDNPEIKDRLDTMNENLRTKSTTTSSGSSKSPTVPIITIPVVVYVVHNNEPLGTGSNIPDSQVQSQLTALNTYYSPYNIKFCLATKAGTYNTIPVNTGNIQNTNGIIHINSPSFSYINTDNQSQVNTIKNLANPLITEKKYLRIWVVNSITNADNDAIQGFSFLPNTSENFDGVAITSKTFGSVNSGCSSCNLLTNYDQGKTLAHEIGHYLGLYHTFQGNCTGTTDITCVYEGDQVCDTPSTAGPNYGCPSNVDSCNETPINKPDDVTNYMDYTNDACRNHFTPGQAQRIYDVLDLYRNELYSLDNMIYTGVCGADSLISASFKADNYIPCKGSTIPVSFTALAQNGATYSWNFGDPGSSSNTYTSTSPNTSHIFASTSNLPCIVTLTVTNNSQSTASSEPIFITNCQPILNSNSYWVIGSRPNNSGLSFKTGKPVFDPLFPTDNTDFYGFSVQNDATSNLMLYSSYANIWNGQHTKLNTAAFPTNNINLSSSLLIVQKPNSNKYYVFSHRLIDNPGKGFRFHTVNVTGNSTSGYTTTLTAINQPVSVPAASSGYEANASDGALVGSGVTAIKSCNGYWILTTLKKYDLYYMAVYSLTDAASNDLTFVSEYKITPGETLDYPASIISSPDGNKIFLYYINNASTYRKNYLFDFNKITGTLSNPVEITVDNGSNFLAIAASFSPDSKLLYTSSNISHTVNQYDISAKEINNSKIEIAKLLRWTSMGSMLCAPDGKLYITEAITKRLMVIHYPNIRCSQDNKNACYFSQNGITNDKELYSLPNIIVARNEVVFNNTISAYITDCNKYKFFPNVCSTSFKWDFDDLASGATNNTSTDSNPIHTFVGAGSHLVKLMNSSNTLLATITINIIAIPTPVILGDSSACTSIASAKTTNNSVVLASGQTAIWTVTAGAGTISGANNQSNVIINWTSLPGTISLTVKNVSGCVTTVTKTIASAITMPTISGNTYACVSDAITETYTTSLPSGTTGTWSIISGTGSIIGANNLSSVDVNWTSLPAILMLTVTNATGCIATKPFSIAKGCTCDKAAAEYFTFTQTGNTISNFQYLNSITGGPAIYGSGKISFGDGSPSESNPISHTYASNGTYEIHRFFTLKQCTIPFYDTVVITSNSNKTAKMDNAVPDNVDSDILIYPNPNGGTFTIAFTPLTLNDICINIYDISGREIFVKNYKNQKLFNETIQLNNLQTGIYLINISDGVKSEIKKIIIE